MANNALLNLIFFAYVREQECKRLRRTRLVSRHTNPIKMGTLSFFLIRRCIERERKRKRKEEEDCMRERVESMVVGIFTQNMDQILKERGRSVAILDDYLFRL